MPIFVKRPIKTGVTAPVDTAGQKTALELGSSASLDGVVPLHGFERLSDSTLSVNGSSLSLSGSFRVFFAGVHHDFSTVSLAAPSPDGDHNVSLKPDGTLSASVSAFDHLDMTLIPVCVLHVADSGATLSFDDDRMSTDEGVRWDIGLGSAAMSSASAFAASGHNHSLANLTEKSYSSLSDKPTQDDVPSGTVNKVFTATEQTKLAGIAANANNYSHPNHSGDVASVADGATTIANSAVTLAKMANLAANSIIGNATAGSAVPTAISCTSAGRALLDDADATAQRTTLGLGTAATGTTGTAINNIPTRPAANALSADTISEITSGVGVTVDSVLFKDGAVILGTDPGGTSKIRVVGSVRVGNNTASASSSEVGGLRYRVSGNNSYVDMCMQTGASSYAWVNIIQSAW